MAGAMRKVGVYLGLVEDADRFDDEYDDQELDQERRESRPVRAVRTITIERNADPARIKVVGNVTGDPIRGVLRHRGWEATRVALPPLAASGLSIIAPAEVEVS